MKKRVYIDPIVEEVRKYRQENAARFGYDVRAILEDARKREKTSGHKVVLLSKRKPKLDIGQTENPLKPVHEDPIVGDVRRHRFARAAKFNFNLGAICEDARKREKLSGHKLVQPPKRKARPQTG